VLGFFIFWVANVWVVIRGSESIKHLEAWAAPLCARRRGAARVGLPQASISDLFAHPQTARRTRRSSRIFLRASRRWWASGPLSLNIPDFSRFARSQKSQIIGQIVGLPLTMLLFAGLGVVMTAASAQLVGETISDPIT
jgi:NCS1 family nucleobase:cation symporter-1